MRPVVDDRSVCTHLKKTAHSLLDVITVAQVDGPYSLITVIIVAD